MLLSKAFADTKHASVLPTNVSNTNTAELFPVNR